MYTIAASMEEQVLSFMALTGSDHGRAENWLMVANGDLQLAIQLFFAEEEGHTDPIGG